MFTATKGDMGRRRGIPMQCGYCGAVGHEAWRCRNAPPLDESQGAPVEHQDANGLYTGPAKVRTIPQGVSGEELGGPVTPWGNVSPARGRAKQRRQAALRAGALLARGMLERSMIKRAGVGRDLSGRNLRGSEDSVRPSGRAEVPPPQATVATSKHKGRDLSGRGDLSRGVSASSRSHGDRAEAPRDQREACGE